MNTTQTKSRSLLETFEHGDLLEVLRQNNHQFSAPLFEQSDQVWPIRIYTLGRFSLLKDEQPIDFPGRAKRKPMDLLKALIALGGRDVCQIKIEEILWPDADGDAAHRSLDTTLHRLRKLLGNDRVIILREGKISLNNECCWVDAWAFERMQSKLESCLDRLFFDNEEDQNIITLATSTLSLYKGSFLGVSSSDSWAIAYRERLRSKFIRLLRKVGRFYDAIDAKELALEAYLKGLEIDNLLEEMYQKAMECYIQLDLRAEALVLYQRCANNLQTQLNIRPSQRTEQIYHGLLNS